MDSDSQVIEISVTHQKKKVPASPIVINSEDDTPSSPPPAQREKQKFTDIVENLVSSSSQENNNPKNNETKTPEEIDGIEEEAEEDEEIYEVEKIMNHKKNKDGTFQYYIKWKNYSESDNTWEPEDNLNAQQALDDYWKEYYSKHPEAANATPKEKEKPKKAKSTPKEPKRSSQYKSPAKDQPKAGLQEIKGIIKRDEQIYFYCIYNNSEKLISNQEMKNKFSAELLNFYEKNIVFSETIKIE